MTCCLPGSFAKTSAQLLIQLNYLDIIMITTISGTYDHRVWKTGLPVRSAVLKPHAGELVVGWVTTSESSLLYVFVFELFGLTLRLGYH
ncbi:L-lysine 2-3-aminomutase [Penicillium bovifimosum]|uniref:L-lysine 2-3-aminomutase n=1 Tax=Penicillium bovifimosum TaxID=126998 RepID=A0A9W9GT77_9EURO|nr:L-lysine 2-3-aminomutase [Penicillium bovifimosum]KAJ5129532.1 L-lysine 2-3-aminomutase [Penicillium bovifimosum]